MVKVTVRKKLSLKQLQKLGRMDDTILVGYDRGVQVGKTKPMDIVDMVKLQSYGGMSKLPNGEDIKIPARPFLIDGIDKNISDINEKVQASLKKRVKTGKDDFENIGKYAEEKVIEWVESRPYVPNSPRTLPFKEGDLPLEDTGFMLANITSHVIRKDTSLNTDEKSK